MSYYDITNNSYFENYTPLDGYSLSRLTPCRPSRTGADSTRVVTSRGPMLIRPEHGDVTT